MCRCVCVGVDLAWVRSKPAMMAYVLHSSALHARHVHLLERHAMHSTPMTHPTDPYMPYRNPYSGPRGPALTLPSIRPAPVYPV